MPSGWMLPVDRIKSAVVSNSPRFLVRLVSISIDAAGAVSDRNDAPMSGSRGRKESHRISEAGMA